MKKTASKSQSCQEFRGQLVLPMTEMLRESLLDFVVDSGLGVLQALLEEERTEACGPRYRHDRQREARRNGHAPGELILGGRRVSVRRPRARTTDGEEVILPSWTSFSAEDPLDERTVEQMVLGVSTRKYGRSLEPLPEGVKARGTSKSAASRRFVRATKEKLHELTTRRLDDREWASLMIDGVEFAEHVMLVALGIDVEGRKQVLGLEEGATENSRSCRRLLVNLRERGFPTERSLLVALDGSKALKKAVRDVFGEHALVQRCQEHKKRNVTDKLPEQKRAGVRSAMTEAYMTRDAARAKRLLENLARRLRDEHPGAAASLDEGLEETLTVMALGLPEALERTLSTTNPIENLLGNCRHLTRNVKRWKGGSMILRWLAASMEEASKGFRRLRGYRGMPQLVAALRQRDAELDRSLDERSAVA